MSFRDWLIEILSEAFIRAFVKLGGTQNVFTKEWRAQIWLGKTYILVERKAEPFES